jgi:hypothetical protein
LYFSQDYFQFPNDPIALLEWFAASVVLVIVVTLVYVYVLNKSPPPQGETVSKMERSTRSTQLVLDPDALLLKADAAVKSSKFAEAVEFSARAVGLCLTQIIQRNFAKEQVGGSRPQLVTSGMGIADLAYLVQTRAKSAPRFAETVYELNNLRLKAARNQTIDLQQAIWAFSVASSFCQLAQSDKIKF